MIIKDFENLLSYECVYPVDEWVMVQFRKRKNKNLNYFEFLLQFTTDYINVGVRKYGEFEDEWYNLKRLLQEQTDFYHQFNYFPTYRFHIILDQALILEYEGNHIPNLLR